MNNTYIILGLIALVAVIWATWNSITRPPKPLVRFLKSFIQTTCDINTFTNDLTGFELPRPDDKTGGGKYQGLIQFGFKAGYSFSHRSLYEKFKECANRVKEFRVDVSLINIIDGIDQFIIIEREKGYNIHYLVTFSSKKVRGAPASHCLVAVTVTYRIVEI